MLALAQEYAGTADPFNQVVLNVSVGPASGMQKEGHSSVFMAGRCYLLSPSRHKAGG